MHTISVSLSVFRELTNRLQDDDQTFDDLLREILEIDSPVEPELTKKSFASGILEALEPMMGDTMRSQHGPGFYSRGLFLPDQTQVRARYKGRTYAAFIRGEDWIDESGNKQSSPSAAATAITDTNVNGLRFWEAKRPGDIAWRRLDQFR